MGKTAENPDVKATDAPALRRLTEEEAKRRLDAFNDFMAQKQAAWDAMTAEERAQADREWEIFKRAMNEGRPRGMEIYPD